MIKVQRQNIRFFIASTEGSPVFAEVFKQNENWREMITGLPKAGLFNFTEAEIDEIKNL